MKQLILLAAILFSGPIFGQAWVPIGTKWEFKQDNFTSPGTTYNWPVTCTDTVEIAGKFYSKIEYPPTCSFWGALISPVFLRADSNRVFYHDNGEDKLLYDFKTPLLGTWTARLPWMIGFSGPPSDSFKITVFEEDTFLYFGQIRRVFWVQYGEGALWGDYFIEGIGSNLFLFPQLPVCDSQAYCLHKFHHPDFGTIEDFGNGQCAVSTQNILAEKVDLKAAPNPSSGKFTIENQQVTSNSLLEIFSFSGNKIREFRDPMDRFEVDLGGEPAGVYIAKWTNSDGRFLVKKLVLK